MITCPVPIISSGSERSGLSKDRHLSQPPVSLRLPGRQNKDFSQSGWRESGYAFIARRKWRVGAEELVIWDLIIPSYPVAGSQFTETQYLEIIFKELYLRKNPAYSGRAQNFRIAFRVQTGCFHLSFQLGSPNICLATHSRFSHIKALYL